MDVPEYYIKNIHVSSRHRRRVLVVSIHASRDRTAIEVIPSLVRAYVRSIAQKKIVVKDYLRKYYGRS